jgi:restriction endonuclease S subunit
MAISRKIGQDSEGQPIFRRDAAGRITNELDHDLNDIFTDYISFKSNSLIPSEYRFSIMKSELEPDLSLNPQRYLPDLNLAIQEVLALGDKEGWSVATIGEISDSIWKGIRFKREDLEVDINEIEEIYRYHTPASVLQTQSEGVKCLDLSRCSERRKKIILQHIGKDGQIVISRSGTIGRVSIVNSRLVGDILSDDLIRVEVSDEDLRIYIYMFLRSPWGQKQMLRNEYGSVQQHLEPGHIRDMVIPIPNDKNIIKEIVINAKNSLDAAEMAYLEELKAQEKISGLFFP